METFTESSSISSDKKSASSFGGTSLLETANRTNRCPRRRGNDSAVGDVIVPVPARDKLLFPGDKVLKTLSIVLDKEKEGIQTGPITFSPSFFPPKVATGQKHDDNLLESPRLVGYLRQRLVRYVFARGVSRNVGPPPSYLIRLVIAAESSDDESTRGTPLARSLPRVTKGRSVGAKYGVVST